MSAAIVFALALVAGAGAAPARAQAQPAASDPATVAEAQRRFHRGIELYKEGDLSAAVVEFKRAYERVPNYKILFNLGQVSYQRHDHAAALRYFRQYLGEGDTQIPIERQREVAAEILALEQRVGRIDVSTPEDGAEVFIDDVLVGTTPVQVHVNAGSRRVIVTTRSGEPLSRVVEIAGGELRRVTFTPRAALPAAPPPAPPAPPPPPAPQHSADAAHLSPETTAKVAAATVTAPASPPRVAGKSTFPWKSWTVTGLLAAGAAATGTVAYLNKRDLDAEYTMFPPDAVEVDYYQRRTRGFALATDGLLIGTAIMAALSLYLTYRTPR
jgi:hypothetical protein